MEKRSVSIAGAGKVAGGEYHTVKISGSGKVEGDLVAEELRIAGAGKVEGAAKVREIVVSGTGRFEGPVEAESFHCSGACKVEAELVAKEVRVAGILKIEGNVKASYFRSGGGLKVEGSLEADLVSLAGITTVTELLAADRVEMRLEDASFVREIGGETIEIKRRSRSGLLEELGLPFFRKRGTLQVSTIEGDEVYLEGTQAKLVRGKKIHIGPGCLIDRVEYEESLEVHPDSRVKEEVRG
ncbi:TPA: polymer-forming cytoskeletal protein [Candidatus Bipolaricaulota bacterium]|nr:polymer-forming cytoskeletal protein [Candidatus Bipolaricaulota bacterium]